jgi:hypothetical protein
MELKLIKTMVQKQALSLQRRLFYALALKLTMLLLLQLK